jgi:hypothetical protein
VWESTSFIHAKSDRSFANGEKKYPASVNEKQMLPHVLDDAMDVVAPFEVYWCWHYSQ